MNGVYKDMLSSPFFLYMLEYDGFVIFFFNIIIYPGRTANMILLYAVYQVLAVQEKSGKFRGSGVWKFPTGVVDQVCKVPASTEIQRTSLALLFSTLLL